MLRAGILATLIVLVHLPAMADSGIYQLPSIGGDCVGEAR